MHQPLDVFFRGLAGAHQVPQLPGGALGHQALEFLQEAQVRGLAGVRDEAEDGAVDVPLHRIQDPPGEVAAERLAFLVDVRVVAAAEVDALEGALPLGGGGEHLLQRHAPVRLHDEGVAGREFLDVRGTHAEHRGQGRAFARHRDGLGGLEPECGADAIAVAEDERIAVADDSAQDVAAVEALGGVAQDARDVHLRGDDGCEIAAFQVPEAAGAGGGGQELMLAVDEVPDLLEDHAGVGVADRVDAELHQPPEQVPRVGQVEVAGEHQVAARHVAAAQVRMAEFAAGTRVRAVAEVADHHFAEVRDATLELRGVEATQVLGCQLVGRPHGLGEDPLDRRPLRGAHAVDERLACRHVALDHADAGAVLSAVVLLLHQEVEPAHGPQRVAELRLEPFDRLLQPDHCKAAFVGQAVAHGVVRGFEA